MKADTYTPGRFDPQNALRTAALLGLLAVGVTSSFATRAAPPPAMAPLTQSSAAVTLSDLDLSTDQGTRVAYDRIRAAAKQVCSYTTRMGDYVVGGREVYLHCYSATMANAIKQVNRRQLVALHAQVSQVAGY